MLKRISGIVGWIGTAIVFAAVAVRFLHPGWERYSYWMAWAGLACIVAYAAMQWRDIGRFFSRRQARLGTAAVTSILVMLGILVAVNYLASRENKRWDLTSSGEYTLSDQTRKLLSKLDAPLKMIVFDKEANFDRYRLHMPEYEYASKKVSVEYVDPDKNPTLTRQYQIQSYGTIAMAYKTRTERVVSDSEQDIANGIIKVVTGEQKKVYFVQGHGERDTANSERAGYSGIVTALGRDNYSVDKLTIALQGVPADASVVIIAGPKTDLLEGEAGSLRAYLQRGGKLLLLLDPREKADSQPPGNLLALARDWDIQANDDIVVDQSSIAQIAGPVSPVVGPPYPASPITEGFGNLTQFFLVRSITPISGGINGHNAQTFVQTGPNSWGADATRLLKANKIDIDEGKDRKGPISIAAAVSAPVADAKPTPSPNGERTRNVETRVAVIGDSDFVCNYAGGVGGNIDLFMNTVSWLAQQENLIAIRPKEPNDRRLTLTAVQQRNILLLSLIGIPLIVVATGVYTWWRRR